METKIKEIFEKYKENYHRILSDFYPAMGSTGFTERNQTVNFSKAVEALYPNAFTWFEVPYGDKSRNHIDAIIFNNEKKEIFIIEAKRFSNADAKIRSMGKDINRILNISNLESLLNTEGNGNYLHYTYYGIILADVWMENPPKEAIYINWNSTFLKEYEEKLGIENSAVPEMEDSIWDKCDFDIPAVENYRLLMMTWEIPK